MLLDLHARGRCRHTTPPRLRWGGVGHCHGVKDRPLTHQRTCTVTPPRDATVSVTPLCVEAICGREFGRGIPGRTINSTINST